VPLHKQGTTDVEVKESWRVSAPPGSAILDAGLARIRHFQLFEFYRYWDRLRDGQAVPSRAELDPLEFWTSLGYVSLFDVVDGRFRYRLGSGNLLEVLGEEMTGRYLDQMPSPSFRAILSDALHTVVESCWPLVIEGEIVSAADRWHAEGLFVPLSTDRGRVDAVALCSYIEKARSERV
jgi:hypothetical protein